MAQNITERAKDIVNEALANVPAISVEDALSLVDSDDHVFVDLRDRSEQTKTGGITGAVASSRGMLEFHLDPESPAHIQALNIIEHAFLGHPPALINPPAGNYPTADGWMAITLVTEAQKVLQRIDNPPAGKQVHRDVELVAGRHSLDRLDLLATDLDTENEA